MPSGVQRTLGVSGSEAMVNSGGEQFFLFGNADTPATVDISFANLPDGTSFAGQLAFAGIPSAFTTSSTNYIFFKLSSAVLESNASGFAVDNDIIPLWTIDVDGSGVITNIFDKRPWFPRNAGATEGAGIFLGSDGLAINNTLPKPSWTYGDTAPSPTEITFDSTVGSGRLAWTDDIIIRFNSGSGFIDNLVTGASSPLDNVADGDVVYFDINRTTGGASVTLVRVAAGSFVLTADRHIFGIRQGNNFIRQGDQTLLDQVAATYTPLGIDLNRWQALQDATGAPTSANPFATVSQITAGLSPIEVSSAAGQAITVFVIVTGMSIVVPTTGTWKATFSAYEAPAGSSVLTYALYLNAVLVTNSTRIHTTGFAANNSNIQTQALIAATSGDTIDVRASDSIGTTMLTRNLIIMKVI